MKNNKHYGSTLKEIRENKKLTQKEVADGIMTIANFSKQENEGNDIKLRNFIELLERLNVSVSEFLLLTEDEELSFQTKLEAKYRLVIPKKKKREMQELLKELETIYSKSPKSFLLHMICNLKFSLLLRENKYEEARQELKPIADYLNNTDQWYYYEISLFNTALAYFDLETAFNLGDLALKSIEKSYAHFQNDDLSRKLLNNLAIHAYKHQNYFKAYSYSSTAIGLPNSAQNMFNILGSKIINQVSSYQLGNDRFDKAYLAELINALKLSDLEEAYEQYYNFAKKEGIDLD